MAKLTHDQWIELKERYIEGEGLLSLAKSYGLSVSTVHERKEKEKWELNRVEYRNKIKKGIKGRIEKKITETEKPKTKKTETEQTAEIKTEQDSLEIIVEKGALIKVKALELLEQAIIRAKGILDDTEDLKANEVLSAAKVASEGIENIDKILGIQGNAEEDKIKNLISKMDEI